MHEWSDVRLEGSPWLGVNIFINTGHQTPDRGSQQNCAQMSNRRSHSSYQEFFFLDPSQDVILFERRTYSPFLCGEAERSTPQKGDKTQLIKMNHLWNLSFCVISKDEDKSAKRNDTAHPSSTQGVCLGERFGRERRAPQKSMLLPFGPVIVLLGIRCRGIILNIEKASCTRLICYFIFKNYSIMYINKTWKQPIYPTIEEEKVNYIVWLLCGY